MPDTTTSPRIRPAVAALVVGLCLASVAPQASAQAVVDPRSVEFSPSPDHDVENAGVPLIDHYDLEFYLLGGASPFQVANIGKPAPDADGRVRIDLASVLASWPAPGVTYESRVAAVGTTGTGRSTPSNTFSFAGPCTYTVAAPPGTFPWSGGAGSLSVTAGTGCDWDSSSAVPWITLNGSGTGSGSAPYTVAANSSAASRSGTITVAGRSFTISQAGGQCTYSLAPASAAFQSSGGNGSVNVSTSSWCSWTPTAPSWITILSAASSSGGAAVISYRVGSTTAKRTGSITVGSGSIAVLQNGPSAPRGAVAISPSGKTVTQPFMLTGWAADLGAAAGTGVTAIHVYALTATSTTPIWLGVAQYGLPRGDIGSQFGAQYTNSGYSLTVSGLPAGKTYKLMAYARSAVTGLFTPRTLDVTVQTGVSKPRLSLETLKTGYSVRVPFRVGGWALDLGATTGTGVARVEVRARKVGSSTPAIALGDAAYGLLRNDLAPFFGSRYVRSGYLLTVNSLPPGTYDLSVLLHSLVTNTVTKTVTVRVTILP
jgi:hypothetical protein